MPAEDAKPVDTADADDAELLLADPEDYHKAQRLKEIHEARQRVAKRVDDMDINGTNVSWESVTKLAQSVALYAEEVLALRKQMDREPIELPDGAAHDTVEDFAITMGMVESDTKKRGTEPAGPPHCMTAYRACNDFLAEVKPLVTEDETNEWEV